MKKAAILMILTAFLIGATPLLAQYYSNYNSNYIGSSYGSSYGTYGSSYNTYSQIGSPLLYNQTPYFSGAYSTSQKIGFGIDQGFGALFTALDMHAESKAVQANLNARRTQLENTQTLKRLQTEGPVPFATHSPSGQPRSPKITWEDVQSID